MELTWIDLALAIGLTARAIRLAVVDEIARPFRDGIRWAGEKVGGERGLVWADDLVTCPYCIGFWISMAVTLAWIYAGHTAAYQAAAIAGTLSYVAGRAVATLDLTGSS